MFCISRCSSPQTPISRGRSRADASLPPAVPRWSERCQTGGSGAGRFAGLRDQLSLGERREKSHREPVSGAGLGMGSAPSAHHHPCGT